MEEVWKDVQGYEGLYKVSNLGNIYSKYAKRNLNLSVDSYGYKQVHLYIDGTHKRHLLHRLVAKAFITNEERKPQVNHIDENKTNNNVKNLEWVSQKENINHGTRTARQVLTQRNCQKSKEIICSNGKIYHSTREASRVLKIDNSSVVKVLKGIRKSVGGYTFKYKEV